MHRQAMAKCFTCHKIDSITSSINYVYLQEVVGMAKSNENTDCNGV